MKKGLLLLLLLPSLFVKAQLITTVIGNGTLSSTGDGGPATAATVAHPDGIAFDKYNNLYIADFYSNIVRKVSPSGVITTFAGPGISSILGDGGPATAAYLQNPYSVACDTSGNVYISDYNNIRVRKVNAATGIITTVAGTGTTNWAGSGDGSPATNAEFNHPTGLLCDRKGNLYITDNGASTVRRVDAAGIITNVAGIGLSLGFSGDGGPATAAQMHAPVALAIDDIGNLYIGEQLGRRVRMVDTAGIISSIAGTGASIFNGDGIPATAASLACMHLAYFNECLYVTTAYDRVRKIDLTNDSIYTVAGTDTFGYNGDDIPATTAKLNNPEGIAITNCGDIYFSDYDNSRVRKVAMSGTLEVPVITLTATGGLTAGSTQTVTAAVAHAGGVYSIRWFNHGVQFAITTTPSVTFVKSTTPDVITARVISRAWYGCHDSTLSAPIQIGHAAAVNNPYLQVAYDLYPNPASTQITLWADKEIGHVTIYNLLGQTVFERSSRERNLDINIAHLQAGIYLVQVNGQEMRKFVKE